MHPVLVRCNGLEVTLQMAGNVWFSSLLPGPPGSMRRLWRPCSLASCISRMTLTIPQLTPCVRSLCQTRGLPYVQSLGHGSSALSSWSAENNNRVLAHVQRRIDEAAERVALYAVQRRKSWGS